MACTSSQGISTICCASAKGATPNMPAARSLRGAEGGSGSGSASWAGRQLGHAACARPQAAGHTRRVRQSVLPGPRG